MNALRAYIDTQQQTASRERLMVMLFEAALRHIRTGAAALEAGKRTAAHAPFDKACDIVKYLMATLDVGRAPELCKNLANVYTFVIGRLVIASAGGHAVAAREAERVLAPVVMAFAEVVAASERGRHK